jgi:branched-subunit amino acid transport protein
MIAAIVTVAVGIRTRSAIWGIGAGIGTLYLALWVAAIR